MYTLRAVAVVTHMTSMDGDRRRQLLSVHSPQLRLCQLQSCCCLAAPYAPARGAMVRKPCVGVHSVLKHCEWQRRPLSLRFNEEVGGPSLNS